MPKIPDPADPSTAANAVSGQTATAPHASPPQEPRWFSLRGGGRAKQFAVSLKTNARWMKEFLHGRR